MSASFASLGLSSPLLRAVKEQGYQAPTPIQIAAIPNVLRGDDLKACAQTGSGKTAAFALPILQVLARKPATSRAIRALVLAPTRELAMQISEAFTNYSTHLTQPLTIISVFGGVSINPQMMALRGGADIVVATPGRLLDLVDHNALDLRDVSTVVLDEADKLCDLGFADELNRIVTLLPKQRQTLLFSATFPDAVQTLASKLLQNAIEIDIPVEQKAATIVHRAIAVDAPTRTQLLRHLITDLGWTRALVFVATKYATEHVAEKLRRADIRAGSLHGELSQSARTQALADFKASKLQVLIATDVAARGIDIEQLPVVVNYDLPRSAVDYVHRIGRTGRAGLSGIAVSFVSAEHEAHFRLIEKRNEFRIERETIPGFEPTSTPEENAELQSATDSTGGIKGKRKSKKDKLREAALAAKLNNDLSPAVKPSPPRPSVWPTRKR
jgi:ATP-dependent RNA helicase RhlE